MFGLEIADFAVLVIYLVGITGVGIWAAKLVTNMGDFFMPRKFGKSMMVMHTFGTGTHSDQAIGVASKTFSIGLSGIWYQWLWLFCTPFYWLIAPLLRRFRALTTADVFEARYNLSVAMLYALVGISTLMVVIGLMLKGSGTVISTCLGGGVSTNAVITIMTVLFLAYGIAGGLAAAIITDYFQGILTIVFSFLLLPFILNAVGGMKGLRVAIDDPEMFTLVAPEGIGIFYIVVIAINALIGWATQPHIMGNCAAGRTEMDGRFGATAGNFIKRICTIPWALTGLAGVAYFAGRQVEPDQVFGLVAREFLPPIMPGLLGIFLASMLASVMSSCDSFMVASSALFTENIYKPFVRNRPDKHYLLVGRITSLGIVLGGVWFAFWLPGVIEGMEIFWKIGSMMGIAFWLGVFWRGTTVAGAWASTLGALLMWWLTTRQLFIEVWQQLPFAGYFRFIVEKGGQPEFSLPWQMVLYLSTGVLAGIVVSLMTKPVAEEKLENFYRLLRTPVEKGEGVPPAPCTIPDHVISPPARKIFPGTSLEFLVPSRISVIGFIASWFIVAFLILIFYLIVNM